jgi:hypothetical protein
MDDNVKVKVKVKEKVKAKVKGRSRYSVVNAPNELNWADMFSMEEERSDIV